MPDHDHQQRARCSHVGAQAGAPAECKVHCVNGEWAITSPLYLMGSCVGQIVGRGKTKEEAAADLHKQLREASDSLFA